MTSTLCLVPTQYELDQLFTPNEIDELAAKNIFVHLCGLGPAAAAFMAGHLIQQVRPDQVLLVGIAGAHPSTGLKLGQAVSASSECFADLGFEKDGLPNPFDWSRLPLLKGPSGEPIGPVFTLNPLQGLPSANFMTVNTATASHRRANYLLELYEGQVENMEGAGVALACSFHGIPLTEIRGISNFAGDRDRSRWEVRSALSNLKTELQILFETRS